MNKFGLSSENLNFIVETFKKFTEVEKVVVYGSRSKGNYKNGSDIDLALFGSKITLKTLSKISYELENNNLIPLFFDLVHYETLRNNELKKIIDREGQEVYIKSITNNT
jgi:predicted nucleotidyltransferase